MITRLASGWGSDRMPGRVFRTKQAARLALAWIDVQNLLSEKAKEALRGGGYAGEQPLIQALIDSANHWKSVGDEQRASEARAKADEMLSPANKPAPQAAPTSPMGLNKKPAPKGGIQVFEGNTPLLTLPTNEMAEEFIGQYQQAKGDEELEQLVYDDFKGRSREAMGLPKEEPKEAPVVPYWQTPEYKERQKQQDDKGPMRAPASLGDDEGEVEHETFQLGDMRIEAETKTQMYPKKPVFDPKSGKTKHEFGKRQVSSFEVFHPSQELPIYRFFYTPHTNTFSVRSNLEGKTKQVRPRLLVRSETLDAIRAKNPAAVAHKPDWRDWTDKELADLATALDMKPVYRPDPDQRNIKTVPAWQSHDAQSPGELSRTLAGFVDDPSAMSVMNDLMSFLGAGSRKASSNVVVRIAM